MPISSSNPLPVSAPSTLVTATDGELLEAARAGDEAALHALLERHQARIYRFGMKMCRHPEDAEDVLQETLIALARGIRAFRGHASLSTWLYTVARSFCVKKRRRDSARGEELPLEGPEGEQREHLEDPARKPDEALASRRVEAALDGAIRALDPMYREVLLLRDVEGLSAPEVAEILGVSVQAVKSRLHRARLAVREKLAPTLGHTATEPDTLAGCPDVLTMFSRHLEGEIGPEVCRDMERHVEGCPHCRGACESLKQTLALCRSSAPDVALPPSVEASVRRALSGFLQGSAS